MEQRIVKLQIANEYIAGAGVSIGAVGSHDDVLLEMDFRSSAQWDGTTRRAIFSNALGENRTPIILTTNLLAEGQSDVYLVPVPAEAKDVAGECFLTVEGYIGEGESEILRVVTEEATFRVRPSKLYTNANPSLTPTEAEQIQAEIDEIKEDIVGSAQAAADAAASEQSAAQNAQNAAQNAQNAAQSAQAAGQSATSAASSAAAAAASQQAAAQSETQAEYWAGLARETVGGDFATRSEAQGYVSAHNQSADAHGDIRTLVSGAASAAAKAQGAANSHAARHSASGPDPITPYMIGAVNKAGDTMTGALRILADVYASGRYISPSEVRMYAAASDGTTGGEKVRQLSLYSGDSVRPDIRNALQLQTGAGAEYNVLHTGNKPSGSYTGNGDATARTIETGGIGNAALVWSSEGMGFLTRMGIVYCPLNSSAVTQNNSITFADGIINIAANSAAGCNTAGITYYYQVL